MSDYKAAEDYILSFADYERIPRQVVIFDLKRIQELLRRLGQPQEAAKSVHIAGTKGKGSTSAMIASILMASGYKTGFYSSPHLLTMRERIRFEGKPIPEEDLARLVDQLKLYIEDMDASGQWGAITTFEILTALAFLYYREKQADYQVLEVGLGGRLDATNVVKPEVCVITSISLDHTHILGNTLAKIAAEKAGIIKPGSWVVNVPQHPEAAAVIEERCREQGARLISLGSDVSWSRKSFDLSSQSFRIKGMRATYDLTIPLLGAYQLENAAAAVATAELLAERGARISAQSIAEGLTGVEWPGRLQILQRQPLLVVDGAHNPYSVSKLGEALREYLDFERAIIIVGATADKDITGIVAGLASFANVVIVTRSHHPKSTPTSQLLKEFSEQGARAQVAEDVPSALEAALAMAGPRDLICATGSLFVVAEVMEYWGKRGGHRG